MVELVVKIKNIELQKEIKLTVPQKWNELSPKQLLYIAKHWESWQTLAKINESLIKARALLFLELSGLESKKQKRELCNLLSFVDEDTDINILDFTNFVFEKLDLTKQILPKVKVGMFEFYYGPNDRINDISIDEFSYAFGIYNIYNKFKNDTYLNSLMAILYRPRNNKSEFYKTGDFKVPFNNKLVNEYEKKIKKLPEEYKQAVYLFFCGCLESLAIQFPNTFERGEAGVNKGGNFINSVVAMSGKKFGFYDEAKKQNAILFLTEMEEEIVEYKKRSKK